MDLNKVSEGKVQEDAKYKINKILVKYKWAGDDAVRDIVTEAFMAGANWHKELVYGTYPKTRPLPKGVK